MYQLIIDDSISERFPEYGCVVVYAKNLLNSSISDRPDLLRLRQMELEIRSRFLAPNSYPEAHVSAWRDAYHRFGAKPKKHLCSVDALVSRVLANGAIPDINPVVNIYNRISLEYMIPVGGEDWHKLSSNNVLRFSDGSQQFKTRRAGEEIVEHPDIGEVIWCDSEGVTCRRWNWRQCVRTAIVSDTTAAYFVLDVLPPFGLENGKQAAYDLQRELLILSPEAEIEIMVLQTPKMTGRGIVAASQVST